MTKLLTTDLRDSMPVPFAIPLMTDRLYETQLNFGQVQAHQWELVHVKVEDDRESPPGLTDFIRTVPFQMVSKRFRDLLIFFNSACEFLPLIVHYKSQEIQGEYFALNALRVVDEAIDLEQSKIGYYDAEFHSAEDVEKLVLKPNALGDQPLGYLGEISHYAVSDSLANAIQEANLVGVALLEPSKFTSY